VAGVERSDFLRGRCREKWLYSRGRCREKWPYLRGRYIDKLPYLRSRSIDISGLTFVIGVERRGVDHHRSKYG
jgi:hypothetical protein